MLIHMVLKLVLFPLLLNQVNWGKQLLKQVLS